MLIKPLQGVCNIIQDKKLEKELRSLSANSQNSVYSILKKLLVEEVYFIIETEKKLLKKGYSLEYVISSNNSKEIINILQQNKG